MSKPVGSRVSKIPKQTKPRTHAEITVPLVTVVLNTVLRATPSLGPSTLAAQRLPAAGTTKTGANPVREMSP